MNESEYKSDYSAHLLEQYKLFVEIADRISTRRAQINKFYIILVSVLLVLVAISVEKGGYEDIRYLIFFAASILGLSLCFIWFISVRSYRLLNSGKFRVIHEMEQQLPFAPFKNEWEALGKGELAKKYRRKMRIEGYIPLLLSLPYWILFFYSAYYWIYYNF